jgi:hypothetical protein
MIEVVFSDSEKGSMRLGKRFATTPGVAIGVIRSEDGQTGWKELAEAKPGPEWEMRAEKPLGGQPEDVIGLSFRLDIGDIASPVTAAPRRDLLARMLSADPWDELASMEDSIEHYWNGCVSDLNQLTARAKDGEAVRIWYSDAPYSMCGFYSAVDCLKDCGCRLSAIRLPRHTPLGEHSAKTATSWGEIAPGEFAHFLLLESEIPASVQKALILEWETLKRENAPLRAVLNGKPHSVETDFYDRFIRKEIPEDAFKAARLIGLVLGNHSLGVGDWLIAQRVRQMIESRELVVVQPAASFYGTTLEKARHS